MSNLRNVLMVSMISFGILGHEVSALSFPAIHAMPISASAANVEISDAVEEAHSRWIAGAQEAALQHGCTKIAVEQQPGESIDEAVKLFALTANEGSCLLLQPVSTEEEVGHYSVSWGGKVGGIDIVYISDVAQMRIWNGVAVATK